MNLQHVTNLEETVINSILIDSTAMSTASKHLRTEMFSDSRLALIYTISEKMYRTGENIDILSFKEALIKESQLENAGGSNYLVQLINHPPTETNTEVNIRLLKYLYLKRKLTNTLRETLIKAKSEAYTLKESLAEINRFTEDIANEYSSSNSYHTMPILMEQVMVKIGKHPISNTLTGIPTGISELDNLTSGWQPGELILLASSPSAGKTTMALHIAKTAAKAGYHTAIYSPDMPSEQLADRWFRSEAPFMNEKKTSISEKEIEQAYTVAHNLSKLPLFINDNANIDMEQVYSNALIIQRKGKCNLIVIDSLQQCGTNAELRNPTVTEK